MVNYLIGEKKTAKDAILVALNSLKTRAPGSDTYENGAEYPRQLFSRDSGSLQSIAGARQHIQAISSIVVEPAEAAPAVEEEPKAEEPAALVDERFTMFDDEHNSLTEAIPALDPSEYLTEATEAVPAMTQEELLSFVQAAPAPTVEQSDAQSEAPAEGQCADQTDNCTIEVPALTPDDIMQEQQAQITRMQAEIQRLEAENQELKESVGRMTQEIQSASKSVHIAWQQGYLAGQHAATEEFEQQKNFIEQLKEAAQAATTYGDNATPAAGSEASQEAQPTGESEPADAPYIAEALQITDPEVLNDPFTAKLLDALGVEIEAGEEVELQPVEPHEVPPMAEIDFEQPSIDTHAPEATGDSIPGNSAAEQQFSCQPDGLIQQAAAPAATAVPPGAPVPPAPPRPAAAAVTDGPAGGSSGSPVPPPIQLTPPPVPPLPGQPVAPPVPPLSQSHAVPPPAAPANPYFDPEVAAFMQSDAASGEAHQAESSVESADGSEDGSEGEKFSADDLHNLFRNKYVRPDADPAAAVDPAASGSFPSYKKFVGANKSNTASDPMPTMPRVFPAEIRKACRLLGLNPEELTNRSVVTEAWKREMAKPGVHPDTGGDTEMAIYLNTAKDTLMRWIDDQSPKLGKKFGSSSKTAEHVKPKKSE